MRRCEHRDRIGLTPATSLQERRGASPTRALVGHELVDVGTDSDDSVDYREFAAAAARLVADGDGRRGP